MNELIDFIDNARMSGCIIRTVHLTNDDYIKLTGEINDLLGMRPRSPKLIFNGCEVINGSLR